MSGESKRPEEEAPWFSYGATLRIFGEIPDLDGITRALGFSPTHTHRRGGRASLSERFEHDMWSYTPPVPKDQPLDAHIEALWSRIQPRRDYLLGLKKRLTVDVFLSYSTNCCAGLAISHRSLEMFIQLEIPVGISIIA